MASQVFGHLVRLKVAKLLLELFSYVVIVESRKARGKERDREKAAIIIGSVIDQRKLEFFFSSFHNRKEWNEKENRRNLFN